MIRRSDDLYYIGYALSRLSSASGSPPPQLSTSTWRETYDLYFQTFGAGREAESFRNTLKNVRDAFDAFNERSARQGWRDSNGAPPSSGNTRLGEIRQRLGLLSDNEIVDILRAGQFPTTDIEKSGVAYSEGGEAVYLSRRRERSAALRQAAIEIHGFDCMGCGFNFEKHYGLYGRNFIEVHHAQPLSLTGLRVTDPSTDLNVLCSNCHRMVHRKRFIVLSLSELRALLVARDSDRTPDDRRSRETSRLDD